MFFQKGKNFTFWKEVFEFLGRQTPEGPLLNGETQLVYDGVNLDDYPSISVLGVFQIDSGRSAAISVTYDVSYDRIEEVSVEVQKTIEDLKSLCQQEQTKVLASTF